MRILLFFLFITFYSSAQNIESVKIASKLFNYEVFWGNDVLKQIKIHSEVNQVLQYRQFTIFISHEIIFEKNIC